MQNNKYNIKYKNIFNEYRFQISDIYNKNP